MKTAFRAWLKFNLLMLIYIAGIITGAGIMAFSTIMAVIASGQ